MKKKILFALGYRQFEEALEVRLKNKYELVGTVTHRDGIVNKVRESKPDIILLRESIPGSSTIIDIIYKLKQTHSGIRIIFMSGKREPGDILLSDLVRLGVYDIITGEQIKLNEVLKLLEKKNTINDVFKYIPQPRNGDPEPQKSFNVVERVVEVEKDEHNQGEENKPSVPQKEKIVVEDKEKPVDEEEPVKETQVPTPQPSKNPLKEQKEEGGGLFKSFKKKTSSKEDVQTEKDTLSLPPVKDKMTMPEIPKSIGSSQSIIQSKQIISFVGAVNGVGNTQLAFNTAVKLANDGHKVLFVELNPNFSTIDTSLQIGSYQYGLDKVIENLQNDNQRDLDQSIIKMEKIKTAKNTSAMNKNYKRMPSTLDFMLFSQDYQTLVHKPDIEMSLLKDLFMLLLLQEGYDYLVIDSEPLGKRHELIQELASISSKFFITITQDVAQIGHVTRNVIELNKRIKTDDKLYYVLNKEVESECSRSLIEEWLNKEFCASVPDTKSDFVNAAFLGIPFTLHSKNVDAQSSFEEIKNIIQQK